MRADGDMPIDPSAYSLSALCFSFGHCFVLFNEIYDRLVYLANLMSTIVVLAILIAPIVLL
jgi:hypothetical protein